MYGSLSAGFDAGLPAQLFSADLPDFCYEKFKEMSSLHKWLLAMVIRSTH